MSYQYYPSRTDQKRIKRLTEREETVAEEDGGLAGRRNQEKKTAGVRFPGCCDERDGITIANSLVGRNYSLEVGTEERRLRVSLRLPCVAKKKEEERRVSLFIPSHARAFGELLQPPPRFSSLTTYPL